MKCHYPNCDFEGTQAEVDDHLANIGTDSDHEGLQERLDRRAEIMRRLNAAYAGGDQVKADLEEAEQDDLWLIVKGPRPHDE